MSRNRLEKFVRKAQKPVYFNKICPYFTIVSCQNPIGSGRRRRMERMDIFYVGNCDRDDFRRPDEYSGSI